MGEPGTKEVLNLSDLEAAGGIHTGRKHILTLLVENSPGVLARVAGVFARPGVQITTPAGGPPGDPRPSRITLTPRRAPPPPHPGAEELPQPLQLTQRPRPQPR